jgi:hypothetical protein
MDFNEFLTYLFVIPASAVGAYYLFVFLNKKWPFWRDFRWQPVAWGQAGGYFIWAWKAILKRPWLLWVPVALSLVWYSILAIMTMILLARRTSPRPEGIPVSDYEKIARIFTPLNNALSSYSIHRLVVYSVEVSLTLFLVYFLVYFFNIRRFRQFAFADGGGDRTVQILHWTALVSGFIAIAEFLAVHFHIMSIGFGSGLWDSFLFILFRLAYMLPFWPLGVLVLTWVLRIFEGLEGDRLKGIDFRVAPGQFTSMFFLLAFNDGILLLHERFVNGVIFNMFQFSYLVNAFAELSLPVLMFAFLFAGPVIVLKGHGIVPAIRESVRFLLAHAAEMLQIVVISFPILLLAAGLGDFLSLQALLKGPEPISHVRLMLGQIVLPLIHLALQIILALALFHFWHGKAEPASAESSAQSSSLELPPVSLDTRER